MESFKVSDNSYPTVDCKDQVKRLVAMGFRKEAVKAVLCTPCTSKGALWNMGNYYKCNVEKKIEKITHEEDPHSYEMGIGV
jgi:hypothetical protein